MFTVIAPAKINLTLEILAKRTDGYHEIRSVFQTINLCDRISFKKDKGITVTCNSPGWQIDKSLVHRAAHMLQEASNYNDGARLKLTKCIPFSSGLGGDSSGAAAVLCGLNRLWDLKMLPGDMVQMASELGSDVPYFLTGGTALVHGRGENVSPLPTPSGMWIILLRPDVTVPKNKTASLYALIKSNHYSDGTHTDELVTSLTRGQAVNPRQVFNVFEKVAYDVFSGLERYRAEFLKAGAEAVHLAGSGPMLFAIFDNHADAGRVYNNLRHNKMKAYLVDTVGAVEPI